MTAVVTGLAVPALPSVASAAWSPTSPYVVSDSTSTDGSAAAADVTAVGASVDQALPDANAVLAGLTWAQVAALQSNPAVTVTADATVGMNDSVPTGTLSGAPPAAVFPQQTGATTLWSQGHTGAGVNVAVVDTGIDPLPDFAGRLLPGVDLTGEGNAEHDDYGHGTFVAGLIAGNGASSAGRYDGEAPGAGLVPVKVAGASGETTLATVIQGIDWVIDHRAAEHIGVMNLSLGYVPVESSTVDPLDQAVERAWDAGIVVVISAGNSGPFNGTVLSPGDDPLAITVGAVNDHGSTSPSVDTMANFSSVGPTNPDGSFKPDLVTSGTSVVSLMAPGSTVATSHPGSVVGTGNFVGSGTSFSSAITSGAVALLLSKHPNLRPDDVKAALLATTAAGPVGNPFVDGHGLLDVAAAASERAVTLQQQSSSFSVSQPLPANLAITPGETVQAGDTVTVPGSHPALTTLLSNGQMSVPLGCSPNGAAVGSLTVALPATPYSVAATGGSGPRTPPARAVGPAPAAGTLQASATAPDLCNGAPMYPAQASSVSFTGALVSTDTTDPEQVQVVAAVAGGPSINVGSATVTPEPDTVAGTTVDLGEAWESSTWNPAEWKGLPGAPGDTAGPGGSDSDSATASAWAGSTWSGSTWDGSFWRASAWQGSFWRGASWNGSFWRGSAWDGSFWRDSAWLGSAWSGSFWRGLAWS